MAILVLIILLVQVFYPNNRLLPFEKISEVNLGLNLKSLATEKLDQFYQNKRVEIYLANKLIEIGPITLSDLGISVDSKTQIDKHVYPLYLRLVPGSIFWAHHQKIATAVKVDNLKLDQFIVSSLLPRCQLLPIDATIKIENQKLVVDEPKAGGECNPGTVKNELLAINPFDKLPKAQISMKEVVYQVSKAEAQASADMVSSLVKDGVQIMVDKTEFLIPSNEFYNWLKFTPNLNSVDVQVDPDRASDYLIKNIKPLVTIPAGVVTITTYDFQEVARTSGGDGKSLDLAETIKSLNDFIQQKIALPKAVIQPVPAERTYVRTYSNSDEGIRALFENFANDHSGTFGISYAELSNSSRHANYRGDDKFITASTYKLFVAYSVLKRVESGEMLWDEVADCFNKMISLSDNVCAEAFLEKIGYAVVTEEINNLGLKNSSFTNGGPFTTANDLVAFLGTLENGNMFSPLSRERLISALKNNIFREGIAAGSTGLVANKVGFLDNLLHDAAIIYSPKGVYVLTIMTDGSSWNTIADLTRELEKIN